MKKLSIDEIKKIELDILLHLHTFCSEHNRQYFLAYGTLIGAVRHNGFIPWDDDIDICMPRSDYNWLIENYNKMNPDGRYKLISPYSKESMHSFVKFVDTKTIKIESGLIYKNGNLGIDIDIFPLDGQPESNLEFNEWFDDLRKIYTFFNYFLPSSNTSIKRRIAIPIIRLLVGGRRGLLKKAEKYHAKYPYEDSKFVGVTECLYVNKGDRFEKECFRESIDVSFEGHQFPIPVGYDKVLTSIYGDYMQLPPVEQRVTHHVNNMFLLEEHDVTSSD